MNEHDAQSLVDGLAAGLPATLAPVAEVVGAGRAARRRRRRTTILGAAALVILVVLGGALVPRLVHHRADPADAATRLVGFAGYGVEVPASWPTVPDDCDVQQTAFVYFPTGVTPSSFCPLVGNIHAVDFVAIGSTGDRLARRSETGVRCQAGAYPSCTRVVVEPAAHAYFAINTHGPDARAELTRIQESIRPLTAAEVAVPFTRDPVFDARTAADEAAGLHTTVALAHVAGTAPGTLLGASPTPGTVVAPGSTVTYTVADTAPSTPRGTLTDEEMGTALAVAHEYVTGSDTVSYTRATVSSTGPAAGSDTGYECTHGQALHVTIHGRFASTDLGGPGSGTTVTSVRLLVDLGTGRICGSSLGIGGAADDPDAQLLFANPDPPLPAGDRLVGFHGMAVAVPATWATVSAQCVPANTSGVDYLPPRGPLALCPLGRDTTRSATSVMVGALTSPEAMRLTADLHRGAAAGGVPVMESDVLDVARRSATAEYFSIPSQDVLFAVQSKGPGAAAAIRRIRDSLRVVPADSTTVPFSPDSTIEGRRTAAVRAGLVVRVVKRYLPLVHAGHLVSASPDLGTVVPRGSVLTLTIPGRPFPLHPSRHGHRLRQIAQAVVRAEVAQLGSGAGISAFFSLTTGVFHGTPNTGFPCASGRQLRITVTGDFPVNVIPLVPPLGQSTPPDPPGASVGLVVDAGTGLVCSIGVGTSEAAPGPGDHPVHVRPGTS